MFKTKSKQLHKPVLTGGNGNFRPVYNIVVLAWPLVIEMSLHTFVWIFDTAMVMRLGAQEASGVEYGALILFNSLMILGALGIGANALVARYVGAKDMKNAALTGGQAIAISLMITAVYAGIGAISSDLFFAAIIRDAATLSFTQEYFKVALFSGGFALLPLLVCSGVIRGTGNTRVPMIIALIANTYNVIGDYLLIFGNFGFPELGVRGAALATGSAQLIALTLSLGYLFVYRGSLPLSIKSLYPFNKIAIKKIFKFSIPAGAEELTLSGSRMISASWITILGPVAFAANAAAIAAEAISFMPGHALAIAATTLVAQRLGAGFIGQARLTGYWSVFIGTMLMSAVGMIFLLMPFAVMSIFDPPDPEVVRLGVLCLQIAGITQPFIALSMIFSGALKGTGDTKGPFRISLYSNLLVRLPLMYIFIFVLQLEVYYIWWVMALQYAVSALLLFIRYQKKKWTELEAIPTAENIG